MNKFLKPLNQPFEMNKLYKLLFIDIKRAFDSLDRVMAWKILANYGIPEKILNMNVLRGNTSRRPDGDVQ